MCVLLFVLGVQIKFRQQFLAYIQNKMAPVFSKLLLLEEEEKEDGPILAVAVAATTMKRKDGTSGRCTPSFKSERDTEHTITLS